MTTAPTLTLPNFEKDPVIEIEASNYGIMAILMQKEHFISYFGTKLSPRMQQALVYV